MNEDIRVLIVEDDPMVSYINTRYTEKVDGFEIVDEINFDKEVSLIEDVDFDKVDLLLLDIYLPEKDGISLLKEIRDVDINVDVIIISAAKEARYINKAIKLGAVDYLIKPFNFERFKDALLRYQRIRKKLDETSSFDQQGVDILMTRKSSFEEGVKYSQGDDIYNNKNIKEESKNYIRDLPKGLNSVTLKQIKDFMAKEDKELTTLYISKEINISRVTVQRYLKYMSDEKIVNIRKEYGTVGRPQHYYKLVK